MEIILSALSKIIGVGVWCLFAGFVLAVLDQIFHFADWPDKPKRGKL